MMRKGLAQTRFPTLTGGTCAVGRRSVTVSERHDRRRHAGDEVVRYRSRVREVHGVLRLAIRRDLTLQRFREGGDRVETEVVPAGVLAGSVFGATMRQR